MNAQKLEESSQKKFALAKKLGQEALTEQFWSVFNGKNPVPQEKYNPKNKSFLF